MCEISPLAFIPGCLMISLRTTLILVSLFPLVQQLKPNCLSQSLMDSKERDSFLASVEAEEDWLDQVSRRLSLPSAAASSTPTSKPQKTKPPGSTGPTTRSTRKRRISPSSPNLNDMADDPQSHAGPPGKRSSRDDGALLEKLEQMIAGVRSDIAKSETNTVARIDSKVDDLSSKLTGRLAKTEAAISSLDSDMARVKADMLLMRKKSDTQARALSSVVEDIVARKLSAGRLPDRSRDRRQDRPESSSFERKYWEARKSLRAWPIEGPDLVASFIKFAEEKLKVPPGKLVRDSITVIRVTSPSTSAIADQVIVRFENIRLRDEIKSCARNLSGTDIATGIQLEAPDHLRSHYQVFQKLGFHIKSKHPGLKRNVKFDDLEQALVMDIRVSAEADWKTLTYADARDLLKRAKKPAANELKKAELDSLVDLASPTSVRNNDRNVCVSDSEDDHFSDAVVISDDENTDPKLSRRFLSFVNANACSLAPKIESLSDCIIEKNLDLAFLTETWLQEHRDSYAALSQYSDRFSLGIINRNRSIAAANNRQYGGVAIVYRYKTSRFDEFPLINPNEHEVVAAIGKVNGIKGKVFCLSCYAPPNLTRHRAEELLEYISDVISEGKRRFNNCTIIVCGDFNQWPAESILQDHPDLSEIAHGPTRGTRCIDRSFTNFGRSITESGTLEPLESEEGSKSDHRMAWAKASFDSIRSKKTSFTFRKYTESGSVAFLQDLAAQSWEPVFRAGTTTEKVEIFQSVLDDLMSKHFKMKTVTRQESDPPWFNDRIKKKIGRRRRVYDRQGRSAKWKKMKAETDKICRSMCSAFLDRQKQILTAPDAAKAFYRNVKSYGSKEKPPIFDVKDLYPGEQELPIAEKLADHFNSISNEFDGLREGVVPPAEPNPIQMLQLDDVVKRLTSFKKPKSMVKGDIFPAVVNRAAPYLASPLLHIYNTITLTQSWPDSWKVEYVTPIPKKTLPQSPSDLRNISCTMLFSKVYESFVLQWLGEQITLRTNQYGGVKGSGTEHFLVQLWQKVLENIEDPRAGTLLTSIDFAKAFNRLDFSHCINCLKAKGTSPNLIRIVASFLTGRVMRVKVGSELSGPRPVLGGVPQGSLLGVFLFNLAIDHFETCSDDVEQYDPTDNFRNMTPTAGGPQSNPVPAEPTERDARHTTPFRTEPLGVSKYVDDIIQSEKLNFDTVQVDGAAVKDKYAVRSGNLFHKIAHQAGSIGMVVHNGKTQLLCIAETKAYVPRVHFFDLDGNRVESQPNMKILGFLFSSDADMSAQVGEIRRKITARIWTLRHLGHLGMSEEDLLKVYRSVILPIHDYCSCVYNSSLTQTQANALERLQAQSLKAIYGYEHSYRALLEKTGLSTLQARRDNRDLKFANKCSQSQRFKSWFPLNPIARSTRQPLMYKEFHARTQRLYKSPLYNMRRRLNGRERY